MAILLHVTAIRILVGTARGGWRMEALSNAALVSVLKERVRGEEEKKKKGSSHVHALCVSLQYWQLWFQLC